MKSLIDIIQEKLIVNSKTRTLSNQTSDLREFDFNNVKKCIEQLKNIAIEKGLTIKFRNKKNDQGDFCIFIYDKSKKSNYLVGFDGYYNKKSQFNFEVCFNMALDYIDKY